MAEKFLTERQLADLTHRSIKSWQRDRIRGGGIPFIKCGGKVLYDMTDVNEWLVANKFSSTSEYGV